VNLGTKLKTYKIGSELAFEPGVTTHGESVPKIKKLGTKLDVFPYYRSLKNFVWEKET
jgi:hypothetical protein